ncbi:MAG: hypothetical protein HQ553_06095 [Chloroflexi bacterium]|nr:hypothetical protein [Chloroflexota bacterium]
MMSGFKAKVKQYFSGKLVIVQLIGGVGAFGARSAAAYALDDYGTVLLVVASLLASFLGYITVYYLGYWYVFRRDYATSGRTMGLDVIRLQLVEQFPNFTTVIPAALIQIAAIEAGDVDPMISVNIGAWFGPQKIVNFIAMVTSNSLKKGWVDHTWSPGTAMRRLAGKVASPFRKIRLVLKGKEVTNHPHMGTDIPRPEPLP